MVSSFFCGKTHGFADINLLVNFTREHDHRLIKRAPCFFNLCIPSITTEYKLSVFFQTTKKRRQDFGLKLIIVADETETDLIDQFEASFVQMHAHWLKHNSIDTI